MLHRYKCTLKVFPTLKSFNLFYALLRGISIFLECKALKLVNSLYWKEQNRKILWKILNYSSLSCILAL